MWNRKKVINAIWTYKERWNFSTTEAFCTDSLNFPKKTTNFLLYFLKLLKFELWFFLSNPRSLEDHIASTCSNVKVKAIIFYLSNSEVGCVLGHNLQLKFVDFRLD